jgi:DNA-binding NarL/FixJ family response regulator
MQPSELGRIRVLIVDDHQVVRLGLRALLERQTGFRWW